MSFIYIRLNPLIFVEKYALIFLIIIILILHKLLYEIDTSFVLTKIKFFEITIPKPLNPIINIFYLYP
jgi:hypothetical protein